MTIPQFKLNDASIVAWQPAGGAVRVCGKPTEVPSGDLTCQEWAIGGDTVSEAGSIPSHGGFAAALANGNLWLGTGGCGDNATICS